MGMVCVFTFYTRGLRRAFPGHGNEHVLAGQFEQKGPGQGNVPSASSGEKPLLLSWAMVVAEAVGGRHGLVLRVLTLQAHAAAALLVSREMGSVPCPISIPFGQNLFFYLFLPTQAISPFVHHPEVPVESTGAQVQVVCASSIAASLVDQILTCPCGEGAALHFLPDFLPYPEREGGKT